MRFNRVVQELLSGEAKGRVTLLGWLKESPSAMRIVMTILEGCVNHPDSYHQQTRPIRPSSALHKLA